VREHALDRAVGLTGIGRTDLRDDAGCERGLGKEHGEKI
jgi:hypothetical protein